MNVKDMTKEDFDKVPSYMDVGFDYKNTKLNSIVIIPTDKFHESGYLCIDYVAVGDDMEPICRFDGYSDVLCIDGIGGYGKNYEATRFPGNHKNLIECKGWSIDCLPKSGYLRLFARDHLTRDDPYVLSCFEIYAD